MAVDPVREVLEDILGGGNEEVDAILAEFAENAWVVCGTAYLTGPDGEAMYAWYAPVVAPETSGAET